jgi:hypothetical protein
MRRVVQRVMRRVVQRVVQRVMQRVVQRVVAPLGARALNRAVARAGRGGEEARDARIHSDHRRIRRRLQRTSTSHVKVSHPPSALRVSVTLLSTRLPARQRS